MTNEPAVVPTEAEPSRSRRRWKLQHAAFVLLAVAIVLAVRARWFSGTSQAAPEGTAASAPRSAPSSAEPEAVAEPAAQAGQEAHPSLIGSWRDQYYGERTMTFRPDGTGTMLIKLDAVGRAIYGEKLLFELAWENRDGVLVMTFTGGEPKDAVATISKLWGQRHEQRIERLTETELHLRSTDSNNLYTLKRLDDAATSAE